MKRIFLITGLIAAVSVAAVLATAAATQDDKTMVARAAAMANFGGTWNLDKTKSQGLSQRLQGADSVQWMIIQNDKTISIESKVSGGQPPSGSGGGTGGGGGMGSGRGMGGPQIYNLDGSETTADVGGGQMTGKAVSKATWSNNGKTLELSRHSTFQTPDGERTSITTQKLELSADGKVLTVTRHDESPRGTTDSTMVFNKQ